MKSVIINAKNKADLTLLMSLAKKLGMTMKTLSDSEIEDWRFAQKIEKGMKTSSVTKEEVMKALLMKVEFKKSFLKDLKTIKNSNLKNSIANCIMEIENSQDLSSIRNLKKLSGYNNYYRVRINDYRLGLKVEKDVVYFVIIEHRKDIYKVFP